MPKRRPKKNPNIIPISLPPQPNEPTRITEKDIQRVIDRMIARGKKKQQLLPFIPKIQPKIDPKPSAEKILPSPKPDPPILSKKPVRSPSWLRRQRFRRDFRRGKM